MACFLPRNSGSSSSGEQTQFPDGFRLNPAQMRSFGREIQNIPESRPQGQRSQSIKSGTSSQSTKFSMEIDSNTNEQENGVKRNSPRKFSLHVKHSSEISQQQQANFAKRLSSQVDTVSAQGPSNSYFERQAQVQQTLPAGVSSKQVEDQLNALAREDASKPTLVAQFSKQIFEYLRIKETEFKVQGYMERQMHISERMRAILVDWIVEAHKKFRLLPETLFMTVNIIDRYLDIATCTREKLQLVGVTALFIAAKYEEIYPPPLKDFSEITQKAYSKAEILVMEGNIVNALKFNLTVPSSLRFLERYSRVEKLDKRATDMAQYLIELSLVEYKFVKVAESLKACAAIYLTNKLFKKAVCWSDVTAGHSQYSELSIRTCALDLLVMLQNASTSSTQAVRKKFLSSAFSEVATIQIEKLNNPNTNNTNNYYPHQQGGSAGVPLISHATNPAVANAGGFQSQSNNQYVPQKFRF